jgi:septal ring-binding cell division protein DamX
MRPLSTEEVANYLSYRMRAAGYRGPDLFASDAVARIARASGGLTRRINILADKALLAAFSEGSHAVRAREARAAVADSEFAPTWRPRRPLAAYAAIGAVGLVLGLGAAWLLRSQGTPTPVARAPITSVTSPTLSEAAAAVLAAANAPAKSEPARATPSAPQSAPVAAASQRDAAPSKPLLQREQVVRLAGYSPGRNPLLQERLEAARARVETEPDTRYSLELYISENSDPARVERFLARARDLVPLEEMFVLPVEAGGRYRIWALYGVYADRDAARQAAGTLPPKYQQAFRPYPRSFAELRRAL